MHNYSVPLTSNKVTITTPLTKGLLSARLVSPAHSTVQLYSKQTEIYCGSAMCLDLGMHGPHHQRLSGGDRHETVIYMKIYFMISVVSAERARPWCYCGI